MFSNQNKSRCILWSWPLHTICGIIIINRPTSKKCPEPCDPNTTIGRNTFSPPPLAPNHNPCTFSSITHMQATTWWRNRQIHPVLKLGMLTTSNQLLSTPPNHLHAAHISTAFQAATVETKQLNDANRSIGWIYCIGTTADNPYVSAGIVACNHILIANALWT